MSEEAQRRRRKQPEKNTFFGGMAILTLGIMVVKLIGMFYKIPLGNIIGEQGNADFQNAYNIYSVLLTISTAGLPVAVSKMISEATTLKNEGEVQRIFSVSLKFFFTIGGISSCIMFFFADQLALFVGDTLAAPSIRALAPAVIFVSGLSAFRGYFQGRGFMTPTAVSQIIEALSKLVLGLSLAYGVMNLTFTTEHLEKYRNDLDVASLTGADLEAALESTQASQAAAGAIVGVTVGTALALCFLLIRFLLVNIQTKKDRKLTVSSEKEIVKKLLSIAIPITLTTSMSSILQFIDAALVQRQLQGALEMSETASRTIYGNYAWALTIYNLPISLVSAVTISVIPAVSGALANHERKKAATIAISALRMTALLGFPMGVGLLVLGEPIIGLLYPNADIELAGQLLSSLGIVACFVVMSLVCTAILQVYGFFYLPILITVAGGFIKILANYILVGTPTIGIYGAPLGNLMCFSFCFFSSFTVLLKVVPRLDRSYALFYKPIFASTIMGGTAWASHGGLVALFHKLELFTGEVEGTLSGTGNALSTLGAIGCAAVVYLVLILVIGGVVKEDVLMMPKGEKLVKLLKL